MGILNIKQLSPLKDVAKEIKKSLQAKIASSTTLNQECASCNKR